MCWAQQSLAVGGAVHDGPVTLTYPATHFNEFAAAGLTGTEANPATNVVSGFGWWYRIAGSDTMEHPFPPPDVEAYYGDGTIRHYWSNVDGKGFQVFEDTKVIDGEGPSGAIFSELDVSNNTGAPLTIHLFHYLDPGLGGTAGDDSVAALTSRYLKFTDSTSVLRYRAEGAVHYMVGTPTNVLTALNDPAATDLNDSGAPSGPGNLAAAFQFTRTVVPGGEVSAAQVGISVNAPRDHVRTDLYGVGLHSDLLFWNPEPLSSAKDWKMQRATRYWASYTEYAGSPGWQLLARDDFGGDYVDEALQRNPSTGALLIGSTSLAGATPPPANWTLTATGDFNADGKADLVWRNQSSQRLVVWTMNGAQKIGSITPSPDHAVDANWDLAGAADFDGDGHRDFLWYNQTTGKLVIWYMDAALVRITGNFTNPSSVGNNNWRAVAVGDYGKGLGGLYDTQDIVWQNDTSHKIVIWYMDHAGNRTSGVFASPDTPDPGYLVVGPR